MGLFSKQTTGALPAAGKYTAALALEDRKQGLNDHQWQAAQEQLQPAVQAFQKIEKDGLESLQIIGCDSKEDPLYVNLQLGWQLSIFPTCVLYLCLVLVFLLLVFFPFMCTKLQVTHATKPDEKYCSHPSKLT